MRKIVLAVALLAGFMSGVAGEAKGAGIIVDSRTNIFGAGHAAPPQPGGGGGGLLPPSFSFSAGSNLLLTFSGVSGSVSCCSGTFGTFNGPDGGTIIGKTDITSFGGISGILHSNRVMFLTGVFLDGTEPVHPAPARLSFTNPEDFPDLSPLLNQVFFIGDGLTDTGGITQRFHIPAGATRLFLGFADSLGFGNPSSLPGFYNDNVGSLTANLNITSASVPEPSTFVLIGFGMVLLAFVLRRREGRSS